MGSTAEKHEASTTRKITTQAPALCRDPPWFLNTISPQNTIIAKYAGAICQCAPSSKRCKSSNVMQRQRKK